MMDFNQALERARREQVRQQREAYEVQARIRLAQQQRVELTRQIERAVASFLAHMARHGNPGLGTYKHNLIFGGWLTGWIVTRWYSYAGPDAISQRSDGLLTIDGRLFQAEYASTSGKYIVLKHLSFHAEANEEIIKSLGEVAARYT